MPSSEQRTINELVTRYQFEPGLRDIYVEGPTDRRVIEGVLEEYHITGVSVFEISSVYVPTGPDEETSNRTMLVKLASALAEPLRNRGVRLACIADSDFDHLTGGNGHTALLLKTDYADMEMYFFSPAVIEKMNRHCLDGCSITEDMRQAFMVLTLQYLFRVSYVNLRHRWRLTPLPIARYVSYQGGLFSFDRDTYIERTLTGNGRPRADVETLRREVEEVTVHAELDPRCFMHGHDYLALLRKMLLVLGERRVSRDEEVLFRLLRACADYDGLAQEPLFAAIRKRFG